MTCEICGNESKMFAWTDTHGVAQCLQCGTPYVLYHYEGEGNERRRIEKEPEIAVRDEWVPLLREYWEKEHRTIPGGHSFPGGQEMASQADEEAFSTWVDSNKARISNLGKQDKSCPAPSPPIQSCRAT